MQFPLLADKSPNTSRFRETQVLVRRTSQPAGLAISMQNTNSNSNLPSNPLTSLDWATRFVPLPPTEFPDDVAVNDSVNERPVDANTTSQTSLGNTGLPCLNDIAGVDPFFNPTQAPQTPPLALSNSDAASSAQSSLAPNSSASPLNDPALNQNPVEQPNHNVSTPPRVEVIGQQANHSACSEPTKRCCTANFVGAKSTTARSQINERTCSQPTNR